jgi:hypothetical protein
LFGKNGGGGSGVKRRRRGSSRNDALLSENNKQAALSASVILRIFSPEYSVCYRFILSEWSKNYPTITPAGGEGKEFLLMKRNKKKITKRRATCRYGLMPSHRPLPQGDASK